MSEEATKSASNEVDDSNSGNIYLTCMRKQLQEYYLLSSAYTPEEVVIRHGEELIRRLEGYTEESIANNDARPADHLDYTFRLNLSRAEKTSLIRVLLNVSLPHLYPRLEKPSIVISSEDIDSSRMVIARQALSEFLDTLNTDEPYLFEIIHWMQENLETYADGREESLSNLSLLHSESDSFCSLQERKQAPNDQQQGKQSEYVHEREKYERIWIYSHHIAAASKRQEIVKLSRRFDLSGFSRPGKPGIICVEGQHKNTKKFWQHIKALQWQKIRIVKTELSASNNSWEDFRRFTDFQEILGSSGSGESGDKPLGQKPLGLDMKFFIKFLEDHGCEYMKRELFGI